MLLALILMPVYKYIRLFNPAISCFLGRIRGKNGTKTKQPQHDMKKKLNPNYFVDMQQ